MITQKLLNNNIAVYNKYHSPKGYQLVIFNGGYDINQLAFKNIKDNSIAVKFAGFSSKEDMLNLIDALKNYEYFLKSVKEVI